ncbi:glycosyltransferase [Entomobacter blattae]|uniref:Glycosyl transferase n=1 Tax=Entomobacter blattae TaxID=2762277 RepID=A0A7H1NR44_9PROT|nr:glycosyltransferase [Entomobacter blattae]QNT78254.1 hypothetical protein JGUZn3_10260 [Entomobacter blattae]
MAIIYNTNYTHNSNSYLTLAIERSAKQLWGSENIVVADDMSLMAIAATGEHDVLICIDGQRIDIEQIRRLRPSFKTMIFWAFEDPFMLDINVKNTTLFDYVFTNDPSCVPHYKTTCHYLPLAANPSLHYRKIKTPEELDYDIFFAGTMWPNRVDVLRHLLVSFPEARFKLVCPVNEYLPPLPADLAAYVIPRPISHEAFIDFANASAVTLTMFRNYASHGDVGQATAPGPRFYELGLAGTAQVVEIPSEMDVKYFESVKGTSLAHNITELTSHIHAILTKKGLRTKLATAAQKSVESSHLYENRLKEMATLTKANFLRNTTVPNPQPPTRNNRIKVMMCTHSTIHEQVWGGVEVYQQILCSTLGRDVDFYFWLRRGNHCRLIDANGKELERFDMPEIPWLDNLHDGPEERAFASVISQYNIDIVHFQHLGHHAFSLPIIAKGCGVGVVFSFHDFVAVCARYNLLDYDQRFCNIEKYSLTKCDICLKNAENIEFGAQATRRGFIAKAMKCIDIGLFGTEHSYHLTKTIYPVLEHKKNHIIGIPSPETVLPAAKKQYEPLEGRPLRVAIVGNFLRSKGADNILNVIKTANLDLYEFHIWGYVPPDYASVLENLGQKNVIVHGSYSLGDIAQIAIADVALNLSIWPETYCISLSESWQYNLIPIVTDIGALGDRVVHGVNGLKVEVGDASGVINCLELIRSDEPLRKQMMETIAASDLGVNANAYAKELFAIYQDVLPKRKFGLSNLQLDLGRLHFLPHVSWKHQAPPRHIFDPPTIRDVFTELPVPVTDWAGVQGNLFYVDEVCGFRPNVDNESNFREAYEFSMQGWFVVPDISNAGTIFVVLLNTENDEAIFMETQRSLREDVTKNITYAPPRSGFYTRVALRGKWTEGTYHIALLNVINGEAHYQLTPIDMTVKEGKIISVAQVFNSNQTIVDNFLNITRKNGIIKGIKYETLPHENIEFNPELEMEFDFQVATTVSDDEALAATLPDMTISGWAFTRKAMILGFLYVILVDEKTHEFFVFATNCGIRHDLKSTYHDAPLCSGFVSEIWLDQGFYATLNGQYRVYLANVVHNNYALAETNVVIAIENNKVKEIQESSPNSEELQASINAISTKQSKNKIFA